MHTHIIIRSTELYPLPASQIQFSVRHVLAACIDVENAIHGRLLSAELRFTHACETKPHAAASVGVCACVCTSAWADVCINWPTVSLNGLCD